MLAFTFPGQGSQRPGMGQAWVDHPSWELVDDASEAVERDVARLLLDAGADELTETRNAQLATFTLSLVVLDAVERLGIAPGICAGHSLGEYTALVATGALSFEDGARVVFERGEAMQAAAEDNPGTMAAILGLDDELVDQACRRADGDVWVANYNAPGQVVIAGSRESVALAGAEAKSLGAKKVLPIPVGGAFHTPYMAGARNRLRKALGEADFLPPEVPVVANVDSRAYREAADWPSLLSSQLQSPVRWRQSLLQLAEEGATVFVELGAGGVLSGLVRRTLPSVTGVAVATPADLDKLVDALAGDTPLHDYLSQHQGEQFFMSERLVVSPGAGVFAPADDAAPETVAVGELIGKVGTHEVRSPFAGSLMGMLAMAGERVQVGQPVAWLRTQS
ncbi:MAG: [acyl-carrier-protein] S-malonyltransferase [Acidimicrobiaceae bacterium]|nr:[acyl-carrier-protein] S-malonyltransferase [Acidimicrobiaceae bacterium]